jgi:pyruvate dehydrogenase E2 component (dihydrolipoamide acetyltransferase)
MSVSVTMPALGESVSEGTVSRWLKQEGDSVEADEPLLEVSTDKVDTEIPSPSAGVLQSIKVQEDETVDVGTELAIIGDADESGGGGGEEDSAEEDGGDEEDSAEEEQDAAEEDSGEEEQDAAPDTGGEEEAPSEPEEADEPDPAAGPSSAQDTEESAPEKDSSEDSAQQESQQESPVDAQPQPSSSSDGGGGGGGAYVTPLVRKLAAEHDVDLDSVKGTGVGGRIRKQDVLDAAGGGGAADEGEEPASPDGESKDTAEAAPKEEVAEKKEAKPTSAKKAQPTTQQTQRAAADTKVRGRTEKLSRLRTVIAHRMVESLQISAQLTTAVEVDVTRIARLRQQAKADFEAREGVKLSFLPFFGVAAVEALKAHPVVNSSIDLEKKEITYHDAVHLGIAVDTERGLLVPVIHDAGDLNLGGMARKIADLAERTRSNQVTPDELGGGTFSLTNTGSRGALWDTPIINQPQVGILGTGAVVKRPAVVDDPELGEVVAVRSQVVLALSYDHRIVDGADAARFLVTVKERLEDAAFEGDLGL